MFVGLEADCWGLILVLLLRVYSLCLMVVRHKIQDDTSNDLIVCLPGLNDTIHKKGLV